MEEQITLFNPLMEDFSYEMLDDSNNTHTYTMRALEMTTFPKHIALFMRKHLADNVYHNMSTYTNNEDDMKKVFSQIDIK